MSKKKPSIGSVPKDNPKRARFDIELKECLEVLMGRRGEAIPPLQANASIDDVIKKVNEILEQLQ